MRDARFGPRLAIHRPSMILRVSLIVRSMYCGITPQVEIDLTGAILEGGL
jgi:hypothetical protein